VGELVVGAEAVYEDISGDLAARMPRVERLLPDPHLLDAVRGALPEAAVLPIGTTARVAAGRACQVEAMEGFAVLRACELAAVPAVEVRAISNRVDDPRAEWRLAEALEALRQALPRLVDAVARASRDGAVR
jgi:futalosine hydrolase